MKFKGIGKVLEKENIEAIDKKDVQKKLTVVTTIITKKAIDEDEEAEASQVRQKIYKEIVQDSMKKKMEDIQKKKGRNQVETIDL